MRTATALAGVLSLLVLGVLPGPADVAAGTPAAPVAVTVVNNTGGEFSLGIASSPLPGGKRQAFTIRTAGSLSLSLVPGTYWLYPLRYNGRDIAVAGYAVRVEKPVQWVYTVVNTGTGITFDLKVVDPPADPAPASPPGKTH